MVDVSREIAATMACVTTAIASNTTMKSLLVQRLLHPEKSLENTRFVYVGLLYIFTGNRLHLLHSD